MGVFEFSSIEPDTMNILILGSLAVDHIIQIADSKPAVSIGFERHFMGARLGGMTFFLSQEIH
jgi:hypothetical protein